MKIATKTLTSLLIITIMTLSTASMAGASSVSNSGGNDPKRESRFQRLTQRHDRKMELRASVLEITPEALKEELKTANFDQVLKRHGFKTREAFGVAVTGKLKDELHKRGWSDDKIQKVVEKRLNRLSDKT